MLMFCRIVVQLAKLRKQHQDSAPSWTTDSAQVWAGFLLLSSPPSPSPGAFAPPYPVPSVPSVHQPCLIFRGFDAFEEFWSLLQDVPHVVFLWWDWGCAGKGTTEAISPSPPLVSSCTCCQSVLLLAVLASFTWLRWCLLGSLVAKLLFFSWSLISISREGIVCKSPISPIHIPTAVGARRASCLHNHCAPVTRISTPYSFYVC